MYAIAAVLNASSYARWVIGMVKEAVCVWGLVVVDRNCDLNGTGEVENVIYFETLRTYFKRYQCNCIYYEISYKIHRLLRRQDSYKN